MVAGSIFGAFPREGLAGREEADSITAGSVAREVPGDTEFHGIGPRIFCNPDPNWCIDKGRPMPRVPARAREARDFSRFQP
ncbi:hypothetical protein HAHE_11940 [Haloferula helveola]|uniref:Uncharacterized protein n=1 Tax=Haloferula helveola TaxID=490095 RepID=A0ABM7RC98_9BACT|nr:hypothetical protein HAHE_11940 [Haloferula helveola]